MFPPILSSSLPPSYISLFLSLSPSSALYFSLAQILHVSVATATNAFPHFQALSLSPTPFFSGMR